MAVPYVYMMHSDYTNSSFISIPPCQPPLLSTDPFLFYFLTRWVWPGPSVWTWVWDYPLETSEFLSGYATEDTDPPPYLFIANSSTRKTGTPLSSPPMHTWLLTRPVLLRPWQLLWAQYCNDCRTLKLARGRPSLCLLALRIFCASFVMWFIIYFVCHWVLISPFFFLMSAFTSLTHFHLHVLTCQLHRETSIWWYWCRSWWNWKGWHLYHI